MKAGECCNREVVIAEKNTEIVEAARLMKHHHVGDLVVVEKADGFNRPIGILTDRDLVVEVLAEETPVGELRVGDVMSFELTAVNEGMGVWETLEKMREGGIRRMPVVDNNGALVGILTLDDLLEVLTEALGHMTSLIRREIGKETHRRK